jgi:hypothetical protein
MVGLEEKEAKINCQVVQRSGGKAISLPRKIFMQRNFIINQGRRSL